MGLVVPGHVVARAPWRRCVIDFTFYAMSVNFLSRLRPHLPSVRSGLGLRELLPEWKALFSSRDLKEDVVAALQVASVAVPLSLAIGLASGVSPEIALVTAIVAGVVGSLFGGTPLLVTGPTAAMAVLIASAVQQYGLRGLLTIGLVVGVLQVLTGLLGLGRAIRLVPMPVVSGFTAGIGAILLVWQLPRALGLPAPDQNHVFDVLAHLGQLIHQTQPVALALTALTLAITLTLPRVAPKLPSPLIAVAVTSALVLGLRLDVPTLGALPHALPLPAMPSMPTSGWVQLMSTALVVYALSSLTAVTAGGVVARLSPRPTHDPDQDLVGLGLSNMAVSLLGGIPAAGAYARAALNAKAGGRTRRATLLHALLVLGAVLLLLPVLAHIPIVALVGVLMALAVRMLRPRELLGLWKVSRTEGTVFIVTFASVVLLDFIVGVQAGIIVALAIAVARLGRGQAGIVHTNSAGPYRFLLTGPITFLSAGKIEAMRNEAHALEPGRGMVFDFSDVTAMDVSGAELMTQLVRELLEAQHPLVIQGALPEVQRLLLRQAGEDSRFEELFALTESDVVARLQGLQGATQTSPRDRLVHGVERFRRARRPRYGELFGRLAKGQTPHTLLITCADSRISPSLITSTDPGELFIVRNVGNLVPENHSPLSPAVSSAIEYGLEVLGVSDVIVCGHSACGAMKALLSKDKPEGLPGVVNWLAEATPVLGKLPPNATPEDAAKANALVQLDNALTNPVLRRKYDAGEVRLHAWFYDVGHSEVLEFEPKTGEWAPLGLPVRDNASHAHGDGSPSSRGDGHASQEDAAAPGI
ncbi:sulfate permease [Cystobacter fuscus]|uniref:carbonic anhydrase n=2 Tax=Cystobacter fuscus TaxID=43 RepID=A0A250J6U0_9BACT|nr:sulfate permease [Cystobacter fuscus]